VQARQRSPPSAPRSAPQAKSPQEVPLPLLWAALPAENRRRLNQIMARVIARPGLFLTKEVPDD
jgi:hypothetical protein